MAVGSRRKDVARGRDDLPDKRGGKLKATRRRNVRAREARPRMGGARSTTNAQVNGQDLFGQPAGLAGGGGGERERSEGEGSARRVGKLAARRLARAACPLALASSARGCRDARLLASAGFSLRENHEKSPIASETPTKPLPGRRLTSSDGARAPRTNGGCLAHRSSEGGIWPRPARPGAARARVGAAEVPAQPSHDVHLPASLAPKCISRRHLKPRGLLDPERTAKERV